MENQNLYHKGIILWVEDNFIEKPILEGDDVWERIFGNQPDRVYRLMDLSLIIATNLKDATRVIKELEEERKRGTYIFCIIDVFIPKRPGETHTFPDGITVAKECIKKSIDFVFLSTAKDINKLLIERGIKFAPFYQKLSGEYRCIIPDTLVNNILHHLKSNINWIDLSDIYTNIHPESMLHKRDQINGNIHELAENYYPFFGPFTDFVDRWENILDLKKDSIIITRCASHNSDKFIQQSILVAINSIVKRFPEKVMFRYTNKFERYEDYHNKHYKSVPTLIVDVIRVDVNEVAPTEEAKFNRQHSFQEMLHDITATNRIVFFVLPNDDSSDAYLEIAKKKINLKYEDIPEIRIGDKFARENLVRNALNLVVKSFHVNEMDHLGDVFLLFPEILIHPISWTILLESQHVAETLSDPFEVVEAISNGVNDLISQADDETLVNLVKGLPFKTSKLMNIGIDHLQKKFVEEFNKYYQEKWVPNSLKTWLLRSWHTPYSIDVASLKTCGSKEDCIWENHSFSVLIDLIDHYQELEYEPLLNDIKHFLNHPTISKVIANQAGDIITQSDWSGLLSERWPYDIYPVPIALSKKLKKYGRFLWFESDNLTYSHALPSTKFLYKSLSNKISHTATLIDQIDANLPFLPEEIGFYMGKFINLIKKENIATLMDSAEKRDEVYLHLIEFMNNMLPLCFLSYAIYNGKVSKESDIAEVKSKVSSLSYGTILGMIRGMRTENLFLMISPVKSIMLEEIFENLIIIKDMIKINEIFQYSYISDKKLNFHNQNWKKLFDQLPDEKKIELEKILGDLPNGQFNKDKLGKERLNKLYDFYKSNFKGIVDNFDSISSGNADIWGTSINYIDQIQKLLINNSAINFNLILDILNKLNRKLPSMTIDKQQSEDDMKKKSKKLQNTGEYFDFQGAPFDLAVIAFSAIERLKNACNYLYYLDGYHCFGIILQMRNENKSIAPSDFSTNYLSLFLESFIHGCEAYLAHIRFLLENLNEPELAERISLKFINKIVLPSDTPKVKKEILEEFVKVSRTDDGYRMYHLGVPGESSKGRLTVTLNKANIPI
jgi:hypothetical protein